MMPDWSLIEVDRTTSTIVLAGRRLPAVRLVCPPTERQTRDCDFCRSLGEADIRTDVNPAGFITSSEFYVPLENGLLAEVRQFHGDDRAGGATTLEVYLSSRTCELSDQGNDDVMWLPYTIALVDGDLVPHRTGMPLHTWDWSLCEPDWAIEHIMRMAAKPFVQPPGPQVQLHRLGDDLHRTCDVICEG